MCENIHLMMLKFDTYTVFLAQLAVQLLLTQEDPWSNLDIANLIVWNV